jgi:hypothetical protein
VLTLPPHKTPHKLGDALRTHLGNELTLVNMGIRTANTCCLNLDQDVVVSKLWQWDLDDSILLWLGVAESLHGFWKCGHIDELVEERDWAS